MVDTDSNCEEQIPMFHDASVYMMLCLQHKNISIE